MPSSRDSFRVPVGLTGWLTADNASAVLSARAVDLSRTGVGLICPDWPAIGQIVRVAVADTIAGNAMSRQWSGRVRHAREVSGGIRVGVQFDWPNAPGARPASAVREGRGPLAGWLDASSAQANEPWPWVVPAVAMAGLAVDQASKTWAASASPGIDGLLALVPDLLSVAPGENSGTLASLAGDRPLTAPLCAAACLALAGLSASHLKAPRGAIGAVAAGLIAGGLLGNSTDRLSRGYVRDFLVSDLFPRWSFNLSDLFLIAGALAFLSAHHGIAKNKDLMIRSQDYHGT